MPKPLQNNATTSALRSVKAINCANHQKQQQPFHRGKTVPAKPKTKDSKPKTENNIVLLMTTAPPENGAWYLGKRLPPIGLMYVAAALEKAGFKVQMLDNYLMKKPIEEVKQLITQINPGNCRHHLRLSHLSDAA